MEEIYGNVWEWGNIKKENKYKKRVESNCDSKQADKNIKHCKDCGKECWEMDRQKAHQSQIKLEEPLVLIFIMRFSKKKVKK